MPLNKYKLFGLDIPHSCDYCQNCIVEAERNFCRFKKSINKKGKCPKFEYNPIMRKISPMQVMEKFSKEDFKL